MHQVKSAALAAILSSLILALGASAVWAAEEEDRFLDEARAAAGPGGEAALRQLVVSQPQVAFKVLDALLDPRDEANLELARKLAEAYQGSLGDDALARRVRLFESWSAEQRAERAGALDGMREAARALREDRIQDARALLDGCVATLERLGDSRLLARALILVANSHVHLGELTAALEWYERAGQPARDAGDRVTLGQIENNRGATFIYMGKYEAAREALLKALAISRELGRRNAEALILSNLGNVAEELGGLQEAERYYLESLRIADETGDDSSRYATWFNLASIYRQRNEVEAEEQANLRALEEARRAGSPADVAGAAMSLTDMTWRRGDRERAREWMDEAVRAAAATDIPEIHVKIEILQAGLSLGSGRFADALAGLERAEAALQGEERLFLTWMIHGNRSIARFAMGDYDEAFAEGRRALEIARAANDSSNAGDTHSLLASHYLTVGAFDTALQHIRAAIDDYNRVGDERGRGAALFVLGALHHRLGNDAEALQELRAAGELVDPEAWATKSAEILLALARVERNGDAGDGSAALERLQQAKRISERIADPQLSILVAVVEAELRLGRGEIELARRALNEVREMDRSVLEAREMWRIHHVEGKVYQAEGRIEQAELAYRRAIEEVERLRSGVRTSPWKAALLEDRIEPYRSLFRLQLARNRVDEAYFVARMAKARTFVERLDVAAFEDFPDIQRPLPEDLVPAEIAPLSSLKAVLRPGEALLDFFVEPDEVFIFVLRPDGLSLERVAMGRAELVRLVEAARRPGRPVPEEEPITRAFEAATARLGEELLGPLEPRLSSAERLFVVPNAELHNLPFAALRLAGRPLVRERAVSVLPAVEILLSARRRSHEEPGAALVVGDPAAGPEFERLPGADREARRVAGILGDAATLLVGGHALESAARARAEDVRVIHLAAHARVDPVFPANSFVALAPGDGEDGRWTAEEIAKMHMRASLVTLSGCRTAMDTGLNDPSSPGDEREGLVRAFLKAGAGSIVANLWETDDAVAQVVLPELYRRMADASPLQALGALQRDMLSGALKGADGKSLAHPFYWAGLVAYEPGLPRRGGRRTR